jgi:Glyoxalase/Bleomycin resistance protein/Dioxygenase superfamily
MTDAPTGLCSDREVSVSIVDTHHPTSPERRDALRLAGATAVALAASTLPTSSATVQASSTSSGSRDAAPLGGVQHFGVAVPNLDRAFEFYTEVLGGTEVMRTATSMASRHNACS